MSEVKKRSDRVVFFSKEDLAWTNMLENAEGLLNNLPDFSALDLNSLLEFYHIKQYFDNGIFLLRWSSEQKATYLTIVKTAFNEIKEYFLKLDAISFRKEVQALNFINGSNFWHLFAYFETFKRIDREIFFEVLTSFPIHIRNILKYKQVVGYYNSEIREFLLTYPESAELLLSHYEEQHTGAKSDYTFPKSLSDADIHLIITAYLDSKDPNPNYIELARNSKYLKLTPKILLKAKRIASDVRDKLFTKENSTVFLVEGGLDMEQADPVIYDSTGTTTKVIYGGLFFDTLTDDTELFSVFSNLFLYTNEEEQIELLNKDSEVDSFEKIFMRSKNEYYTGWTYSRKNMLSLIQLELFNVYLAKKGRSIEELIDSYVQKLFLDTFHIINLVFSLPDSNATPSDKIRLLAPELEYLLKQYKNFVLDGEIDHELLQIDSSPVYFGDVPSLVTNKYVIANHVSIAKLQHYFFEPHGMLSELGKKASPKTLFQLLVTEKINKSNLKDYQQRYIEHLVKEGFLVIDETNVIEITDPMLVYIAGRLRENGSMCYWRYPLSIRMKIDLLIQDGILKSSSKLFTTEETSYINYFLNKKEFTNGQDLRNKYLHGSNNRTLEVQKADYRYFLRIVVLILLKIKDDMELALTSRKR